jgi:hypothetical protein
MTMTMITVYSYCLLRCNIMQHDGNIPVDRNVRMYKAIHPR